MFGMAFGTAAVFLVGVGFLAKAARTPGPQAAWFFGGFLDAALLCYLLDHNFPKWSTWLEGVTGALVALPIDAPSWWNDQVVSLIMVLIGLGAAMWVASLFGLKPSLGKAGGSGKKK